MNRFYLKEFQFFDGDTTVVFNIVALYDGCDTITVAVTRNGKITVADYDLHLDENGPYFEYGRAGRDRIHINDFEEADRWITAKHTANLSALGAGTMNTAT